MPKNQNRDWAAMLTEPNARERMVRENGSAVLLLDYLASRRYPFADKGWTAFNDWLDDCYRKKLVSDRPSDLPYISIDAMRKLVFPGLAGTSSK